MLVGVSKLDPGVEVGEGFSIPPVAPPVDPSIGPVPVWGTVDDVEETVVEPKPPGSWGIVDVAGSLGVDVPVPEPESGSGSVEVTGVLEPVWPPGGGSTGIVDDAPLRAPSVAPPVSPGVVDDVGVREGI